MKYLTGIQGHFGGNLGNTVDTCKTSSMLLLRFQGVFILKFLHYVNVVYTSFVKWLHLLSGNGKISFLFYSLPQLGVIPDYQTFESKLSFRLFFETVLDEKGYFYLEKVY